MAKTKYLSLQGLTEYDELIKSKIAEDDAATLESAKAYVDGLGLATTGHNHDDRYYTEDEIDVKFDAVDTTIGNIVVTGSTKVKEAAKADEATHAESATSANAAEKLATARKIELTGDATGSVNFDGSADVTITVEVADDSHSHIMGNIDGLDEALNGKAASDHNHDDKYYSKTLGEELADVLAEVKSDVDAFFHDADTTQDVKDTLKEIQDYITSDAEAAEQMLLAIAGKAEKEHKHAITDVNGLEAALNGKADEEHGTHVTYGTEAPKMDGTASAGTAATVSRSDHVHPTDTSRASKQEFDAHVTSTNPVHITADERTAWNEAKTHADSAHAPSNAEKNQNAFSNITIGSTTIAADTATDTLTLVAGENVTITPDANGDSITISAKDTVITVDSDLSATSTNPVENKAVYAKFDVVAGAILDNNNRIEALEGKVGEGFEAITTGEIQALFE